MSQPALDAAVEAARAAGQVAMKYYRGGFEVMLKPDDTPVTQADREAERAIVELLGRAFPDYGVLGEEFGGAGRRDICWIVDPIDGTKNFVRRIPVWATLIALEEHGEITVGVIHNPVTGDLFSARRGGGAFLNGERIHVSDATERQRGFGDYLGYALVAEGKADLYAELDLKPWDLAPCKLIVEEAGGRFTDWDGRPTIYTGTALATNGRLHDAALERLRP